MKDWYLRQTPRDRLIVIIVGALTVVGMFYALAWYPLVSRIDSTQRAITAKQETLQFMRDGAARIKAQNGVKREVVQSDKAPYLLIDETIRRAGIEPPERLEPSGDNGARVQFSEVPFDRLIVVLAELETFGLQVNNMTLSRKEQGTVSARFNMERI